MLQTTTDTAIITEVMDKLLKKNGSYYLSAHPVTLGLGSDTLAEDTAFTLNDPESPDYHPGMEWCYLGHVTHPALYEMAYQMVAATCDYQRPGTLATDMEIFRNNFAIAVRRLDMYPEQQIVLRYVDENRTIKVTLEGHHS